MLIGKREPNGFDCVDKVLMIGVEKINAVNKEMFDCRKIRGSNKVVFGSPIDEIIEKEFSTGEGEAFGDHGVKDMIGESHADGIESRKGGVHIEKDDVI